MDEVAIIDLIATGAFLAAVFFVVRLPRLAMDRSSQAFLFGALLLYVLVGFSNIFEHFHITAYFDRFEDYFEILFIPLFLFFAFSRRSALEMEQRIRAEQEVRELNENLERQVQQRTAQLTTANRELESFCYSVSHDLRAPLRHIDGYSQIVLSDHAGQLDEEGQMCLERVRRATRKMEQLIDDLLDLSRLTRVELNRTTVDLSALAREIAADLQKSAPARAVEFRIADGLVCQGDPRLLRVALDNLLGNAWKYTSRTAAPVIEFGATTVQGRQAFFVRDNGVGFDMAYAGKLFGAFQRLHGVDEFEGTGIGLATVQRIIGRHGGEVWAEGKVGAGATLTFTLP